MIRNEAEYGLDCGSDDADMKDSPAHLIAQLRQKVVEAMEKELAPLGLTHAQFVVVVQLANGMAGTPAEFCRLLNYDSGAMSRLLDRIEEKGIIRRVRNAEDRRSVGLELTDKGKQLYPDIVPLVQEVNSRLLKDFSKSEVRTLELFLQRMLANA